MPCTVHNNSEAWWQNRLGQMFNSGLRWTYSRAAKCWRLHSVERHESGFEKPLPRNIVEYPHWRNFSRKEGAEGMNEAMAMLMASDTNIARVAVVENRNTKFLDVMNYCWDVRPAASLGPWAVSDWCDVLPAAGEDFFGNEIGGWSKDWAGCYYDIVVAPGHEVGWKNGFSPECGGDCLVPAKARWALEIRESDSRATSYFSVLLRDGEEYPWRCVLTSLFRVGGHADPEMISELSAQLGNDGPSACRLAAEIALRGRKGRSPKLFRGLEPDPDKW